MDMFKKIAHSRQKNSKFLYFLKNFLLYMLPNFIFRNRLKNELAQIKHYDKNYILQRVKYYNKLKNVKSEILDKNLTFEPQKIVIKNFRLSRSLKPHTNFFDAYEYIRYFDKNLSFYFGFGDVTKIPICPAIVKSRPISQNNQNSVIMNINKVRHFLFIKDKKNFAKKKDKLVGRMAVYKSQPHRVKFYEMYFGNPLCDLGQSNKHGSPNTNWTKNKMSLSEHLDFKFILCLEGNDVATSLKWVMSSNSVAVMPKPTYETWFMEGSLIGNFHYIEIKKDYSDLEERLKYYIKNPKEAEKIVQNAHDYISGFQDKRKEKLIALMTLQKYFQHMEKLTKK